MRENLDALFLLGPLFYSCYPTDALHIYLSIYVCKICTDEMVSIQLTVRELCTHFHPSTQQNKNIINEFNPKKINKNYLVTPL